MIHFDVNLIKAALFLWIIYQKEDIDYSLMVLTQWKVWDLFKKWIFKLNLMYLKSLIYISSAVPNNIIFCSNTVIQC